MEVKQISEKVVNMEEQDSKATPNGMPVYDINEPWIQQFIEAFGTEPSFF